MIYYREINRIFEVVNSTEPISKLQYERVRSLRFDTMTPPDIRYRNGKLIITTYGDDDYYTLEKIREELDNGEKHD